MSQQEGWFTKAATQIGKLYGVLRGSNNSSGTGLSRLNNLPNNRFQTIGDFQQAYSSLAAVYTCVNTIGTAFNTLPVQVKDEKGEIIGTIGVDKSQPGKFPYLMEHPNPFMNFNELKAAFMVSRLTTGNAIFFLENITTTGIPTAIYPLNPAHVTLYMTPEQGLAGYVYRPDSSTQMYFSMGEIIHSKMYNPFSMFWGLSKLAALASNLDTEINIADSVRGLYRNGARVPGALVVEGTLSETEFKRLKEQMQGDYTGVQNFFKPMLLEKGMKWQPMSEGHTDLGTLDLRKHNTEEIFMTFGVPQSQAGHQGKANVKNDHLTEVFWQNTVGPEVAAFKAAFQPLLDRYDDSMTLDLPIPDSSVDVSALIGDAINIDKLAALTQTEKRIAMRNMIGKHVGLGDIPDERPKPGPNDTDVPPAPPPLPGAPPPEDGTTPPMLPDGSAPPDTGNSDDAHPDNMLVLDDVEAGKFYDFDEKAPAPKGPGSRGGSYYIDASGKVRYGKPPAGNSGGATAHQATDRSARAQNRRNAKDELTGADGKKIKTGDELSAAGWESFGPDDGSSGDFGKDKNAAIDSATKSAKENPKSMFVVMKIDGAYVVASKLISDIKGKVKPKPAPTPAGPVQANIAAAARLKPKPIAAKAASVTASDIDAAIEFWANHSDKPLFDADRETIDKVLEALAIEMQAVGEKLAEAETDLGADSKSSIASWSHAVIFDDKGFLSGAVDKFKGEMDKLIRTGMLIGIGASVVSREALDGAVGLVKDKIADQKDYLDGFVKSIHDGTQGAGGIAARAALYADAGYMVYSESKRIQATDSGYTEEKRMLGHAEHCPGCSEAAGRGWVEIGTLPAIGDTKCRTRCRCHFQYR